MRPDQDKAGKNVLAYATPPAASRPGIVDYITATIGAVLMFGFALYIMVGLVGQSLDRIHGWQNLVAAFAIYAIPAAVAIYSFRASIRGGRKRSQQSARSID